jgi:hypothetical protein
VYYLIYNDPYPLEGVKTKEQIDRINDIWIKLGLPDKQISS